MIPGWPYSFVVALQPGRTSWTAILDAQRLRPDDEDTTLAARQLRAVVERLIAAGHWTDGDPEIWIVGDTGYDGPRLAFELADLPVRVLVRVRSDRVMHFPAPPRAAGAPGRPARHGAEFTFKDARTWPEPAHTSTTHTSRYGAAVARSWDRLHPRLTHRGVWTDHHGDLHRELGHRPGLGPHTAASHSRGPDHLFHISDGEAEHGFAWLRSAPVDVVDQQRRRPVTGLRTHDDLFKGTMTLAAGEAMLHRLSEHSGVERGLRVEIIDHDLGEHEGRHHSSTAVRRPHRSPVFQ